MPRKTLITSDEMVELTDYFHEYNIPYKYKSNNHSCFLECPTGNYMSTTSKIPPQELWFIAWMKKWMHTNKKYKLPDISGNRDKIKYFRVKRDSRRKYRNLYEVDLDRAYWEMSYNLNIIDDYIYYRGLWINKLTRLAAVGQCAKKTQNWQYTGKNMLARPVTYSKKTEHLWFNVCYKTGLIMYKAFAKEKKYSLFYWVDGIYVTNKQSALRIMKLFNDLGYDSKIKKINELEIKKNEVVIRKHNHKVRRFALSTDSYSLMNQYYNLQ